MFHTTMSYQSRTSILNSNPTINLWDYLLISIHKAKDRQENTFSISWIHCIQTILTKFWQTQINNEWLLMEKTWKVNPLKYQTNGWNNLNSCPTHQVSKLRLIVYFQIIMYTEKNGKTLFLLKQSAKSFEGQRKRKKIALLGTFGQYKDSK